MMSVATLRSEPAAATQTHGAASVAFARDDDVTRLTGLYQRDPLRVLFPDVPEGEIPTAVLVTTSGGLVGGDRLDVSVSVRDGAEAMMFGQAAEKVYRSAGPTCRIAVELSVGRDGWLEWLPQETILFEGARLERRTLIEIAPGAHALAGEILVFGRIAGGERLSHGLVRDAWEVRRQGRLAWADALHLEDDMASVLADPACFDGATAYATIVHAGDDAAGRLDLARFLLAQHGGGLRAGATVVNGVLVARWLGRDAETLRRAFGDFWAAFRAAAGGLRNILPRLWHV
ncbi:MAG: urease accessory protein UreD [Rhodospirillales bacterium]